MTRNKILLILAGGFLVVSSPITTYSQSTAAVITAKKASSIDVDAQAFITAASISDAIQIAAINNLVIAAKAHSWWNSAWAFYPFVGGNATAHSYNLFNTATFQLTFSGSWTHSSTGATPSSAYADTGITVNSSFLTTSSGLMGFYSGTNATGNYYDLGAAADGGANKNLTIVSRFTNGNAYGVYANSTYGCVVAVADSLGLFAINMQTATNEELWKNGSQIATASEAADLPATTIYLGALHSLSGGGAVLHSPRQFRVAFIMGGQNSTVMGDMYTDILAYETALSRN